MLLLTHIYNMPFSEVCMFIGSLENSDKGSDWWRATLQQAHAQTSFSSLMLAFSKAGAECCASFSSSFAVLSLSDVAAGAKGMQSHALARCPSASLFTLHSST